MKKVDISILDVVQFGLPNDLLTNLRHRDSALRTGDVTDAAKTAVIPKMSFEWVGDRTKGDHRVKRRV